MCTSFEIRHFGPFSLVNGRKTLYVTSPEFLALLTVFSYAKLRKLRFRLIFKNRQPRIRTCDTRPADQASKNPIDVVLEWQNKKAGNMTSRQCTKPRNFDLQKLMLQPTRDLWRYEIRRVTRTVYNAYREGRRHHAMQESFLVLFCCQVSFIPLRRTLEPFHAWIQLIYDCLTSVLSVQHFSLSLKRKY